MFWITLIVSIASSYIIGGLLAQFPDDVAPDDSDPFGAPQSTPASPVPIVFGTRRIKGVNVLWYGKIRWTKIRKKVKAGFKKKKITVGYNYYIAMQMGVAYGFTGMFLRSLYIGEDLIIHAHVASGVQATFSRGDLYGGASQGGGVGGALRFYNGVDNLSIAPILYNSIGNPDQLPNYGEIAQITLSNTAETSGMYIGTSKQIRNVSVVVSNIAFMGNSATPYSDGLDINPITVLRYLLVLDSRFTLLTGDEIDLQSLTDAEQQVWDEGLLFSPIFSRVKTLESMLEIILKLVDGVFFTEQLTGKLTFTLLREITPTGNELVLDNSNVTEIIKTKIPERSTTINEVKLTFTDRGHGYDSRTITSQDLAGFITAGEIHNTKVLEYPSICNIDVARKVCDRDLMQLAVPTITLELELTRVLAGSRIGEQVVINLPEIDIVGEFFRIVDINYGKLDKGQIVAVFISDVYTGNIAVYSTETETEFVDTIGVTATTEITDASLLELPRRLLVGLVDVVSDLDSEWSAFVSAPQTDINNFGIDVYVDEDNAGAYAVTQTDEVLTPTALLESTYPINTGEYDNSGTKLRLFLPNMDIEAQTVVITDDSNVSSIERYALLNDEYFMYTDIVDLGGDVYSLQDIRRGMFDTVLQEHAINSVIYFISDSEVIVNEVGIVTADTTELDVKLDPIGMTGRLGIDAVTHIDTLITNNRAIRPVPAAHVLFNSKLYPNSVDNALVGDTTLMEWRHRDKTRVSEMVFQGDVSHVLEVTVTYTLNIYEADGTTLIHTEIGLTGTSFTYTEVDEFADHGENSSVLVYELISVDSVTGDCLFPVIKEVYHGGYGYNYGSYYGG